VFPCKQSPLRDLASINRDKAITAAATVELAMVRAQSSNHKVFNTTNFTEAQARRCMFIRQLVRHRRSCKMAAECILIYDLSTRKRILACVLRATFNQSL
jgi:hypothetical protein